MSRLTFNPGNHSYYLADEVSGKKHRLPAVSTLLGQLAKPALVKWAARAAGDYAADNWESLAREAPSVRAKLIAGAPDQARNTAAAKGTALHGWAESLIAGLPAEIPEQHRQTVEGLARWWEASGWSVVASEARVWSEDSDLGEAGYAGTCDLLARDRQGRTVISDWKTGAGVYGDHGVQVAAYCAAENLVSGDVDKPMPRVHRLCVVHVRPDHITLHELEPDQRAAALERWSLLRMLRGITEPELTMKETA